MAIVSTLISDSNQVASVVRNALRDTPEIAEAARKLVDESYAQVRGLTSTMSQRAQGVPNPYLLHFEKVQADAYYTEALNISRFRGPREQKFTWEAALRTQRDIRYGLTNKYSWSVPTAETLATIGDHGKILDLGAGSGYWSKLLRYMGTDVEAYDKHGIDVANNHFHSRASRVWTAIQQGTEDAVDAHPDRTLFMSFPPADEPFAFHALNRYKGDKFLFAGEFYEFSCTGGKDFMNLLEREWKPTKELDVPQWICSDGPLLDKFYEFERKQI